MRVRFDVSVWMDVYGCVWMGIVVYGRMVVYGLERG